MGAEERAETRQEAPLIHPSASARPGGPWTACLAVGEGEESRGPRSSPQRTKRLGTSEASLCLWVSLSQGLQQVSPVAEFGASNSLLSTLMFAVSSCRREYSFARDRAFRSTAVRQGKEARS